MYVAEQVTLALLAYSLLIGGALGVIWDIFRVIRIAVYGRRRWNMAPIRLPPTEKETASVLALTHSQKIPSFAFFATMVTDVVFCLVSAVTVIILLFHLNDGEVRAFALFGALLGFLVYYFSVGRLTVFFSEAIIRFIKRTVSFVCSVTVRPVLKIISKYSSILATKQIMSKSKRKTSQYIQKSINRASLGYGILKD